MNAQKKKEKTRHDWELCKNFKFDLTTKWYIHKPESLQDSETPYILWDFEIQTDHLIHLEDQT